jgi:hypothetical protein
MGPEHSSELTSANQSEMVLFSSMCWFSLK